MIYETIKTKHTTIAADQDHDPVQLLPSGLETLELPVFLVDLEVVGAVADG